MIAGQDRKYMIRCEKNGTQGWEAWLYFMPSNILSAVSCCIFEFPFLEIIGKKREYLLKSYGGGQPWKLSKLICHHNFETVKTSAWKIKGLKMWPKANYFRTANGRAWLLGKVNSERSVTIEWWAEFYNIVGLLLSLFSWWQLWHWTLL